MERLEAENPEERFLRMKAPIQPVGYAEGRPQIKVAGTICLHFKLLDEDNEYYPLIAYCRICLDLNTQLLIGRHCLPISSCVFKSKQIRQ